MPILLIYTRIDFLLNPRNLDANNLHCKNKTISSSEYILLDISTLMCRDAVREKFDTSVCVWKVWTHVGER